MNAKKVKQLRRVIRTHVTQNKYKASEMLAHANDLNATLKHISRAFDVVLRKF